MLIPDLNQVIAVCERISESGKKPTTASVKYDLPKNTPFPIIIQGLKLWQNEQQKKNNKLKQETAAAIKQTKETSPAQDDGFIALQNSLSAEGNFTSITDISDEIAERTFASPDSPQTSVPKKKFIPNTDTISATIPSGLESTNSSHCSISDEKFMQLPITEQLLYIKHLLEKLQK